MNVHSNTLPRSTTFSRYVFATTVLALGWGGVMLWLSVQRVNGYNTAMYDLGNMAQAIASVLRGRPMVITLPDGPLSRLALHVELFYFLLVPFWAIWPDPRMLVIAQALLYAAGTIPAYRLGSRAAAHPLGGCCLSVIYLLYPVGMTAVLFDFHGDTLAMPLLLFALEALDRRAWRMFAFWAILAVSCKFYVAAPLGLTGLIIWWQCKERRIGLTTFAACLAYGVLAFFVIRPLFTTENTAVSHRGLNYISFYFGQFNEIAATLPSRLFSAAIVLGPTLVVSRLGWPWLLPALPLTIIALLSTGPGGSYDFRYHHYAIVVPFIVMACAAGLYQSRTTSTKSKPRYWQVDLIVGMLIVVFISAWQVNIPLNPNFWNGTPNFGLDTSSYGVTPRDQLKDAFLAERVPPDVPIAASTMLAPHLVSRDHLFLTRYADDLDTERFKRIMGQVEYVVTDALFDWRIVVGDRIAGGPAYERHEIGLLLQDPRFALVAADDGLLLFGRQSSETTPTHTISTVPNNSLPAQQQFGPIALVNWDIRPQGNRRFQVTVEWRLTADAPEAPGLIAVSRLSGPAETRIVHLPSFALQPVYDWQPNTLYRESFLVLLPERLPPGEYSWHLGWYNLTDRDIYATDQRSRIGDEVTLTGVTIP